MRKLYLLLLSLVFSNVYSQEIPIKEVETDVCEVTVFLEGAQIMRKKNVDLLKGTSIIKFVNLSPFIDVKSIQVKAEGDITVLSVNHQQNYLDKAEKSAEMKNLEQKLEDIQEEIDIENTYLSIISDELEFLQENRNIGGKNEQVSVVNLQQASDFYSNKLTSLKMKEIERNKTLKSLNDHKTDLENQIRTLTSQKEYPSGEILVKVDAKLTKSYAFELTYLVANAGWFPSYDIRAKNINEPIQLVYKANVRQDTKVDWNNVRLKFSSANPNVSGLAPRLITYLLNYNVAPPTYSKLASPNSVSGVVVDESGLPLPGTTVMVEGTSIGAITDMDGKYSITIPANTSHLTYSFIGMTQKNLPISGSVMNVVLEPEEFNLEEVVVIGYGIAGDDVSQQGAVAGSLFGSRKAEQAMQGKVAGVNTQSIKVRGASSLAIPTEQVVNQTTVDFEIKTPYTIKSDSKNYTVDMENYELPAFYQYYSVPKIDKEAFLIANVMDWEKYNLLDGEANIFFENTYVGKTLMDLRNVSDTLEISLGRDKRVSVNREIIKDYTTKKTLTSKKEETRAWKITVRNNKNEAINMIILDQVPVSTLEEIEVSVQNLSGAIRNADTGEIKWDFKLEPNERKEFELRYLVKYPKYRTLVIE